MATRASDDLRAQEGVDVTRLASILSILVGLAFIITGGVAWGLVSNQLAEENITV